MKYCLVADAYVAYMNLRGGKRVFYQIFGKGVSFSNAQNKFL